MYSNSYKQCHVQFELHVCLSHMQPTILRYMYHVLDVHCREKEALMSEKLKEVEKSRQEEALQIQDRAATMISKLRSELETLKGG